MKKLIVIADWASDSLTCQEFKSAFEGFLKINKNTSISFVSSTPSTIHTGFLLSQIVTTEERYGDPLNTVIFQNTDPRIYTEEAIVQAKGADFIIVRLASNVIICGPNAGYDFSFVRSKIQKAFTYPGLDKGSQFRSRELYSRVSAHLVDGMEDEFELEEMHTNMIPGIIGYYVAHIDNFGNIKTTITHEDIKEKYHIGNSIGIKLNTIEKEIKYVNNLFGGVPGELVMYPGSSGNPVNPYMEISIWRHFTEKNATTGIHAFNFPKPGMKIELR